MAKRLKTVDRFLLHVLLITQVRPFSNVLVFSLSLKTDK